VRPRVCVVRDVSLAEANSKKNPFTALNYGSRKVVLTFESVDKILMSIV